jgi:hypothetical protein
LEASGFYNSGYGEGEWLAFGKGRPTPQRVKVLLDEKFGNQSCTELDIQKDISVYDLYA